MLHEATEHDLRLERAALTEHLREQYKQSLYFFTKQGLGYHDLQPATHKPICKVLEGPCKKKLIVVPRGCFKSTICSIAYPIWLLIKDPNHRILLDSELFTNSSRLLREIKGHVQEKHLTELYGNWEGPVWNDGEIIIKQRTKVYKESSITCSGVEANKTGQHYSVIIADDLSSLDNSMTKEQREKVYNHYRLYISLLDPGGTLVVVGTRYSQGDIIGFILDNEVDVEKKKGLIY